MEIIERKSCCTVTTGSYSVEIDTDNGTFRYCRNNAVIYHGNLDIKVNTDALSEESTVFNRMTDINKSDSECTITYQYKSNLYSKKEIVMIFREDYFFVKAVVYGNLQAVSDIVYFSSEECDGYQNYISPRFDWLKKQIHKSVSESDVISCQQWISPPPFSFILTDDVTYCAVGVMAKAGCNNFISMTFEGASKSISLQMEGHTDVSGKYETPAIVFAKEANEWDAALKNYIDVLNCEGAIAGTGMRHVPDWWRQPIFCGWGQMRYEYRQDHDGGEFGSFVNVTDYCMQSRYTNYLNALERRGINPGTVIIDMGWAKQAALAEPNAYKWQDLRGFIDEQHEKGRHVLLWYTPLVFQGLPKEACLLLQSRPVAPDPTNPVYQSILKDQIRKMLSDDADALNADGFKIDFTQNTPSESGVFTRYYDSFWSFDSFDMQKHTYKARGERKDLIQTYVPGVWGVELLRKYIENIYGFMKQVKDDSVLITHTANPYFADVVDVLRLNDLDGECDDVLEVMKTRAKIAKACCREWLIDTDNDLMINKERWRQYITLQPQLGIPDTYYATNIACSGEAFGDDEYELLKDVWNKYRSENHLNDGSK